MIASATSRSSCAGPTFPATAATWASTNPAASFVSRGEEWIVVTTIVGIIVEQIGDFGSAVNNKNGWMLNVPSWPDKIVEKPAEDEHNHRGGHHTHGHSHGGHGHSH